MKQIHLHLPDELHNKLMNKAVKEYRSMQSIVRELVSKMEFKENG